MCLDSAEARSRHSGGGPGSTSLAPIRGGASPATIPLRSNYQSGIEQPAGQSMRMQIVWLGCIPTRQSGSEPDARQCGVYAVVD